MPPTTPSGDADRPRLRIPPLAEPHAHLEKAFTLEFTGRNDSGTLQEAIERFAAAGPALTSELLVPGAVRALRMFREHGVARVRSHTRVGGALGFRAWDATVQAAQHVPDVGVDQVVAPYPRDVQRPEVAELVLEALDRGGVAVGGSPWLAEEPEAAIDASARLAAQAGIGLDLHVDETEDPAVDTLPFLADAVRRFGLAGRASAAHCCSMRQRPSDVARAEATMLAEAGIRVVTCPISNLVLQGRGTDRRGLAPLRILKEAGTEVAIGVDNMRDVMVGTACADPLRAAWVAAIAGHMVDEDGLAWLGEAVVRGNRLACGLPAEPAGEDWLELPVATLADAVALVPAERVRVMAP